MLAQMHQAVGILLINAGLAQGVDEKGRPVAPRRVVQAAAKVPNGLLVKL